MRPCADYVHLRLDPSPEQVGNVIMPFTNPQGFRWGTVLATGPGVWLRRQERRHPLEVSTGDRVAVAETFVEHMRRNWRELLPKDELLVSEDEILWVEAL